MDPAEKGGDAMKQRWTVVLVAALLSFAKVKES
jgi:hypothetical protein